MVAGERVVLDGGELGGSPPAGVTASLMDTAR